MSAYEIMPRVFFGPSSVTFKPSLIGPFTHIINCSDHRAYTNTWAINGRSFLYLESLDLDDFPLLDKHFDTAKAFIDSALADPSARVYIHCLMGMNRSAALAVAYACYKEGLHASEIIPLVQANVDRYALSNSGFQTMLINRFG